MKLFFNKRGSLGSNQFVELFIKNGKISVFIRKRLKSGNPEVVDSQCSLSIFSIQRQRSEQVEVVSDGTQGGWRLTSTSAARPHRQQPKTQTVRVTGDPSSMDNGNPYAMIKDNPPVMVNGNPSVVVNGNHTAMVSANLSAMVNGNPPAMVNGNPPGLVNDNLPVMINGNPSAVTNGNPPAMVSGNTPVMVNGNPPALVNGNPSSMVNGNPSAVVIGNPPEVGNTSGNIIFPSIEVPHAQIVSVQATFGQHIQVVLTVPIIFFQSYLILVLNFEGLHDLFFEDFATLLFSLF